MRAEHGAGVSGQGVRWPELRCLGLEGKWQQVTKWVSPVGLGGQSSDRPGRSDSLRWFTFRRAGFNFLELEMASADLPPTAGFPGGVSRGPTQDS